MTSLRHPLTWWIWSITLAIAVARANNPWLAAVIVGVAYLVVRTARDNAPWSRSFESAFKLGIFIVLVRTLFGVLIGTPIPGTIIVQLPVLPLPDWMAGIRVGGAITQERLFGTLHEGIIMASIVILFGAGASLTSPHRLLRVLPFAIYQFGLAITIATSLVPQFIASIARIREAQFLRGQKKSFKRTLIPLMEESLARSLDLAASMDSRGYGTHRIRSRYRAVTFDAIDLTITAFCLLTIISPYFSFGAVAAPLLFIGRKRIAAMA